MDKSISLAGIALVLGLFGPQSAAAKVSSDTAVAIPNATVPRPNLPQDPTLAAFENIKGPYPLLRQQAVDFFARSRNAAAIPALIAALSDSDATVRASAIHALGILRASQASSNISQALVKDQSSEVRQSAAVTLAYFADPASVPALISAISDPVESVRYAAMRSLGALRAVAAVPALLKSLKSKKANIRQMAASALGQIHDSAAAPDLAALIHDPDSSVRQAVVSALGSIGGSGSVPVLLQALKDQDFAVQLEAARSLARLGNAEGIQTALAGLKHNNPFLRQESVAILGLVGGKPDLAALKAALKNEQNPATKNVIEFSVAQIKARLGIKPSAKKTSSNSSAQ